MLSTTSAFGPSLAPSLTWDARLIRLSRTPTTAVATKAAPLALILSIGMNLSSYRTDDQAWEPSGSRLVRQVWRSAGYIVTPLDSVATALDCIRNGDFDLVLLGNSVPLYDKERLIAFVRSLGLPVRVISINFSGQDGLEFADATVSDDPGELMECIAEQLASLSGKL